MHNNVAPHAGTNELESTVTVILKYTAQPAVPGAAPAGGAGNRNRYTQFQERETREFDPGNGNLYKILRLKMLHAILAVPGADTGNLLMQYPRSTVSADASTESGLMQLRVYMGAVLKRPENVLIMRNVAFNGIEYESDLKTLDQLYDDFQAANAPDIPELNEWFQANRRPGAPGAGNYNAVQIAAFDNTFNVSMGTVYDPNGNILRTNNGVLGHLDDVAMVHRLYGSQIYDESISSAVADQHAKSNRAGP